MCVAACSATVVTVVAWRRERGQKKSGNDDAENVLSFCSGRSSRSCADKSNSGGDGDDEDDEDD